MNESVFRVNKTFGWAFERATDTKHNSTKLNRVDRLLRSHFLHEAAEVSETTVETANTYWELYIMGIKLRETELLKQKTRTMLRSRVKNVKILAITQMRR